MLYSGQRGEREIIYSLMITKNKYSLGVFIGALLVASAQNSSATQTWLAFRCGCAMPLHCGVTVQTLNTNFGTNLAALAFSGTTTYDFYSPPLSQAVNLTSTDKGGGVVVMRNNGTTGGSDFSVTGRMAYFDYDPGTGLEVLIADTGASPAKDVNHTQLVNWDLPNVTLPSNITIPAGHMLHLAMTITLVSGNPGNLGQVIYNGDSGTSTTALFPQGRSTVLNWGFDTSVVIGTAAKIVSIAAQPDGTMLISCAGQAATAYSIQGTPSLQSPAWTTFSGTISDANGLFSFVDANAAGHSTCFYRAVTVVP